MTPFDVILPTIKRFTAEPCGIIAHLTLHDGTTRHGYAYHGQFILSGTTPPGQSDA